MDGLPPGFEIDPAQTAQFGFPVAVNRATGKRLRWSSGGGPGKLTEDQGKAQTYGRLMATAEGQYQNALAKGYNPGSLRNAAANVAEDLKVPFLGQPFAGLGPVIRDDASDAGKKAEMLWQDAQLKAMTGAGQSEREAITNPKTYFPQFGEDATAPQAYETRRQAYEAAGVRAGPARSSLPSYPARGGASAVPPPAQRKVGQYYSTPKGKLKWTGTGWVR